MTTDFSTIQLPYLTTERVLLRGFRPADFERYAEMMADPDVSRHLMAYPHTFKQQGASSDHRIPRFSAMSIRELDSVVLERDLPEHALRKGTSERVVHVYSPDVFEVEFVRLSGSTQALIKLARADIRPVADDDLPAVRSASRRGGAKSDG